jgi:hypothetical protein
MPLVRMLVAWKNSEATVAKNVMTNTLYFNVSGQVGQDPDYTSLVNDLWTIISGHRWVAGRYLDVRAYSMDDPEPRPIKARKVATVSGSQAQGPHQLALALSYYADRNLPRQRGRIFTGPWLPNSTGGEFATADQQQEVLTLAGQLAGLGGVNVDWSLYSPTTGDHTRINHAWVDNSWDIIRSRKLDGTNRVTWSGDG